MIYHLSIFLIYQFPSALDLVSFFICPKHFYGLELVASLAQSVLPLYYSILYRRPLGLCSNVTLGSFFFFFFHSDFQPIDISFYITLFNCCENICLSAMTFKANCVRIS